MSAGRPRTAGGLPGRDGALGIAPKRGARRLRRASCSSGWAAALLGLILLCLVAVAGCNRELTGDDLTEAHAAVARQDWSLAERLLERFLREEQNPDQRWEAWRQLLTVVNAAGQEPRASLELLETMLEEYMDDDARAAVILRRMGEVNEGLHRHQAAANAWNVYIGLAGLTPAQSVEGYRRLAGMQFKLRRFDAAEDTLQQCLALPAAEKETLFCAYDLADQNVARQRWQEAADLSQQILDSEPDTPLRGLAGYVLADALEQLGKTAEALKQFELARDAYPNPPVIDNRITHLRKKMKK